MRIIIIMLVRMLMKMRIIIVINGMITIMMVRSKNKYQLTKYQINQGQDYTDII